jgi:hypothetical protein
MHQKAKPVDGVLYYNRDVRRKLRTGDVLLFRGAKRFSRLIEAVEGGTYSHAAFVLRWNDRAMVAQAEWPRLEAVPTSIAVEKYSGRVDWYRIKRDLYAKLDLAALTSEATRLLGRPFAVTDLVRVGFYNLLHRPVPVERNADQDFFCSEYVAHCFRKAGFPLVKERNSLAVTPDDLARSQFLEPVGKIHWDPQDRKEALAHGFDVDSGPERRRSPGGPSVTV